MNTSAAHLRHRRLVHVANALMVTRYPTALQRTRLADLWLDAAQALPEPQS